jgi:hypothetical protein
MPVKVCCRRERIVSFGNVEGELRGSFARVLPIVRAECIRQFLTPQPDAPWQQAIRIERSLAVLIGRNAVIARQIRVWINAILLETNKAIVRQGRIFLCCSNRIKHMLNQKLAISFEVRADLIGKDVHRLRRNKALRVRSPTDRCRCNTQQAHQRDHEGGAKNNPHFLGSCGGADGGVGANSLWYRL